MRDWLLALHEALAAGEGPLVRVVVASVRGSAPREPGASMLVKAADEVGTIGGGHLEHVATRIARDRLKPGPGTGQVLGTGETCSPVPHLSQVPVPYLAPVLVFPLAASLGQCCGGIVELCFQRYDASDRPSLAEALRLRSEGAAPEELAALVCRDPNAARYECFTPETTTLWLFGAGHVGRALVHVLSTLPFSIRWVDSRDGAFPAAIPDNVRAIRTDDPSAEVADMAAGDWALVLTHRHDEDFAVCEALLRRGRMLDSTGASRPRGWAGVIGSAPKAKRFRQRLAQRGFTTADIARLTMPIGIGGIRSKEPAAIAVAVAAQLLQVREAAEAARDTPLARES